MEDMGRFYVRALHKFSSTQPDEIALDVNDILLVTDVLDENWYVGQGIKAKGYFPISYVEVLLLPETSGHEKLFAALKNFDGHEDGDLKFSKGALIKGLEPVDENWWCGVLLSDSFCNPGIFPTCLVIELDYNNISQDMTGTNVNNHASHVKSEMQHGRADKQLKIVTSKMKTKKGHKRESSWYNQNNTKSMDSSVKPYVKTLYPYEATGPDELSFIDNEIIYLLEHYQGGWSLGKIDGLIGLFPTNYVEIIVDCSPSVREFDSKEKEDGGSAGVSAGLMCNEEVCEREELYGRALYDFITSSPCQIDLKEGDTVTIVKKINSDWYEARHDDGRVGLCPVTYIEVFGSEPDWLDGDLPLPNQDRNDQNTEMNNISKNNIQISEIPLSQHLYAKPLLKPKPSSELPSTLEHNISTSSKHKKDEHSAQMFDKKSPPAQGKEVTNSFYGNGGKEKLHNKVAEGVSLAQNVAGALPTVVSPQSPLVPGSKNNKPALKFSMSSSATMTASTPPPHCTSLHEISATSNGTSTLMTAVSPSRLAPIRPSPPLPPSSRKKHSGNLIQFSPEHEVSKVSMHTTGINRSRTIAGTAALTNEAQIQRFSYTNPSAKPSPTKKPKPPQKPAVSTILGKSDKKIRVVDELLKTEADFFMSMELCLQTFRNGEKSQGFPTQLDLEALFGNVEEILDLSGRLLESLRECAAANPTSSRNIGQCFLRLEDDFKKAYAPYCRNHDSVITLLEKYDADREIQNFFKEMIDIMKLQVVVFDLASILIKPVQRILKYPLLLSELDKCTEDNAPDKESTTLAMQCMANIASYINEFKRRQDLVSKYKQGTDEKLSDKIQKLNIHSTRKKLQRISQMIVGVQMVDEDFNREEQKFRHLESSVKTLLRDVNVYINIFQDSVFANIDLVDELFSYYDDSSDDLELDFIREIYHKVFKTIFTELRVKIETEMIPTLNSLLVMFRGPSKVIKKRLDKLLDYENTLRQNISSSSSYESKEEQNTARSNYEALNSQLLDELPKLNRLSLSIISLTIQNFLQLRNTYHLEAAKQIKKLFTLKLMSSENQDGKLNIGQQFNISHAAAVDALSGFSFIPSTFNPNADVVKKSRRMTLDDSVLSKMNFDSPAGKTSLLLNYPPEKLYQVSKDFVGSQAMDVSLMEGAVVAVLKEGDPMGNRERWYIDDASTKGFILKSFLEPYKEESHTKVLLSSPPSSPDLLNFQSKTSPQSTSSSFPANLQSPSPVYSTQLSPQLSSPVFPMFSQHHLPVAQVFTKASSSSYLSPQSSSYLRSGSPSSSFAHIPSLSSPNRSSLLLPLSDERYRSLHSLSSSSLSAPRKITLNNQPKVMALFSFTARSNIELNMQKNKIYSLLKTSDLSGNNEWWLLRDEETTATGYVPANYVVVIQ